MKVWKKVVIAFIGIVVLFFITIQGAAYAKYSKNVKEICGGEGFIEIARTYDFPTTISFYCVKRLGNKKIELDFAKVYNAIQKSKNELYHPVDIEDRIMVKKEEDARKKRQELLDIINGGKTQESVVIQYENIKDPRYYSMPEIKRINAINISLGNGFDSIVYHFNPEASKRKLIIYHEGHGGDFIKGNETIRRLLREGYSVMAFAMPLLGLNTRPVIDMGRLGKMKMESHWNFIFMDVENIKSLWYFIGPLFSGVSIAEKYDYEEIDMVGFSGGGWTTVIYAALDERIKKSYHVAGSLPFYLRGGEFGGDFGDYEQMIPQFYKNVGYLDLYAMGALGEGRRQVQILNRYDSCCFAGIKPIEYKDIVAGNFNIVIDDTHTEHKVSEYALDVIVKDLETEG